MYFLYYFILIFSKYELILCDHCGSSGTHLACSNLKNPMEDWICASCAEIAAKSKKQTSSSTDYYYLGFFCCKICLMQLMTYLLFTVKSPQKKAQKSAQSTPSTSNRKRKLTSASSLSSDYQRKWKRKRISSPSPSSSTVSVSSSSNTSATSSSNTPVARKRHDQGELSFAALSVLTGLKASPKRRKTRISQAAEASLAELTAIDINNASRSVRQVLDEDFFQKRNLGRIWGDTFGGEGEKKRDESPGAECPGEESPGASRCQPFHHLRLRHLTKGHKRGSRAHWRDDTSPNTVKRILSEHRKKYRASQHGLNSPNTSTHSFKENNMPTPPLVQRVSGVTIRSSPRFSSRQLFPDNESSVVIRMLEKEEDKPVLDQSPILNKRITLSPTRPLLNVTVSSDDSKTVSRTGSVRSSSCTGSSSSKNRLKTRCRRSLPCSDTTKSLSSNKLHTLVPASSPPLNNIDQNANTNKNTKKTKKARHVPGCDIRKYCTVVPRDESSNQSASIKVSNIPKYEASI